MNYKKIFNTLGKLLQALSILLLLPTAVSAYYRESCLTSFLITTIISFFVGLALRIFFRPTSNVIYAKEGFAIVSFVWIAMSMIGCLPFFISGEIPSFVDALFETVSGFTTTGASILKDVESMSRGLLFWRSFTHWIGGMGVLVFIIALLPNVSDRSIHILRAEVPGPIVGKLVSKIKDTAKILYLIYIAMTLIEIIMLYAGGMPFFESVLHSFGTAGTGGFGVKADSITSYSPYIQWTIAIFMMLFGVNFNIYYILLLRKLRLIIKSSELWCYLGIIIGSSILISINIYPLYNNLSETIRTAFFQVSSISTTTGYATTDFNLWPGFSKSLLLVLMLIGACSGSTAGGFKVSRVILLFKIIAREFKRLVHPNSVSTVKLEGKSVEEKAISGVTIYTGIYMI
ncbi:MAG: TrkH family potassium uptake protein, partial [Clostridia bacterium]|nr:TrkH family potassium uptake protein [Clostridia bacterium]